MRAAVSRGPGDIAIEEAPKPTVESPSEAIVRVTHTAVCGSDLWFYRGLSDREVGSRVGHEPMGHHEDRLELATAFGATETTAERGEAAIERARELTGGGANHVLECVGAASAMETAIGVCRPGGTVGYVSVPLGVEEAGLDVLSLFSDNITLRGGVAPVRAMDDREAIKVLVKPF